MEGHQTEAVSRGNLDRLLMKIRDDRGLDLAQYRPRYVERRLACRLRALGLQSYRQYAAYLDGNPDEYERLMDTLTINVTQFFRDTTVFDMFRKDIVPSLLAEKASRHQRMIRVWSAGCASGQEPYSLAMAFLSALGERAHEYQLSVLGTDIDPHALDVARHATYPTSQLSQIPRAERSRFVEVSGDEFIIKPEVTQHCKFVYLNLSEDRPIQAVDVIFCRNVFIYFNREEQDRMLGVFWSALARGGYLVLGKSERVAPSAAAPFELVSGRERIYRKPLAMP